MWFVMEKRIILGMLQSLIRLRKSSLKEVKLRMRGRVIEKKNLNTNYTCIINGANKN